MGLGFSSISNSYVVYGTLCVGFGSTQLGLSLVVKVRFLVPLREVKVRIYISVLKEVRVDQ